MIVDKVARGNNPPKDVNVIIEIPMNSDPIKYEFDKAAGAIIVDRFMQVSMSYPCNYGFVPHTLSDDGDPIDVLVIARYPIISGAIINCKPVGVLLMEDESGVDEKIIAVPSSKLDASLSHIEDIDDVPEILKARIKHFFESYKALDEGKWVKISGWADRAKAEEFIEDAVRRASK